MLLSRGRGMLSLSGQRDVVESGQRDVVESGQRDVVVVVGCSTHSGPSMR